MSKDNETPDDPATQPAALDVIQAGRLSEYPETTAVGEQDGLLIAANVTVVCKGCGELLAVELPNPDPEAEEYFSDDVVCPVCTKQHQRPIVIPVMVTIGVQCAEVDDAIEKAEKAEQAAPPAPQAEA